MRSPAVVLVDILRYIDLSMHISISIAHPDSFRAGLVYSKFVYCSKDDRNVPNGAAFRNCRRLGLRGVRVERVVSSTGRERERVPLCFDSCTTVAAGKRASIEISPPLSGVADCG